ncbi:hypothetical protein ACLOJK_004127, partial [Asimina triloba]
MHLHHFQASARPAIHHDGHRPNRRLPSITVYKRHPSPLTALGPPASSIHDAANDSSAQT